MSANWSTKRGFTSKKGAFINGIWHCECDPRLPAEKFQTKAVTKNHGRWFLTCQKGKPKSCGFFLWCDDAKLREEGAVLSNSRSEPRSITSAAAIPQTPKKPVAPIQAPTPETRSHERTTSSQTLDFEHEESFDWPSSDDEALVEVAAQATPAPPLRPVFETPRKAAKTSENASPGKRTHSEMMNNDTTMVAFQNTGDIFLTPSTSIKSYKRGFASPIPTPAQGRAQDDQMQGAAAEPSDLAKSALDILRKNPLALSPSVERDLVDLLNRHDLRTQGILNGREITRLAVTAREKRIAELQNRITGLEMEKETQRQVIGHLKTDMATSPTKPANIKPAYSKSPYLGRGRPNIFHEFQRDIDERGH
jgi:hypothetical protein